MLTKHSTTKIFRMILLLALLFGMVAIPKQALYAGGALPNGIGGSLNNDPRHSSNVAGAVYSKAEYLFDTLTITGSGMQSGEKIYNVKDLENLYADVQFGCDQKYSITGSEGAYKSFTLSGVRLYELLVKAGLDTSLPDSTTVTIMAKDGYNSIHTLGEIRNTGNYNYYSETGTKLAGNLPVMVAFASNGCPLVGPIGLQGWFDPNIEGYVATAENGGGALKIIFGQTAPGDNNAQYNSKLLNRIIVGNDVKYSQHNRVPYTQYGEKQLLVKMIDSNTLQSLGSKTFTLNEIEAMVNAKKTAEVRNYYPDFGAGFYEGIDLWYLLKEKVGLTVSEGQFTVVDGNGQESSRMNLEYLRNPGQDYAAYYTTKEGAKLTWVKPALVYAQDGIPQQGDAPFMAALPQHQTYLPQGLVQTCAGINLYIVPDPATHSSAPYSTWKNNQISFSGNGLQKTQTFTVDDIERMLELTKRNNYTIASETAAYQGVSLYSLLTSDKLGLKTDIDSIVVTGQDGSPVSFSLQQLQDNNLQVMLVYGKNSKPLVPSSQDTGYDQAAANSRGPLFLVVNGNAGSCVANVNKVVVTTPATDSWKHDREAPFNTYLDNSLRIAGSGISAPRVYSVRELEGMNSGIVREYLQASEVMGNFEGLNLKYLLQTAGIENKPAKITVCSPDANGSVFAKTLSVDDIWSGITSTTQNGAIKPVVLAYAKDGYPLVSSQDVAKGYVAAADNGFGPLRMVVENSKPLCVKYVAGIIIGDGVPVSYTVNYLDKTSGQAICTPRISVGTDGENIIATADKIDVTGYLFNSAQKNEVHLSAADKTANVVNLYYDKQDQPIDIALVLSGSGIPKILYFTRDELASMANDQHAMLKTKFQTYSALAKGGIKTVISSRGIDVADLLRLAGAGKDAYLISTISSDGNRVDLNYNGTTGQFSPQRYAYPDFLTGNQGRSTSINPSLSFYRAESNENDQHPHVPLETELKEADKYPLPTLMVGQESGDDYNNRFNNKYVQQIIIGDKYATIFSISGQGLPAKLNYNLPGLLLQGMEKRSQAGKDCEGISLARLLIGINGLEDTAQVSFITASQGGVTVYNESGAIEHVTELVIGTAGAQPLQLQDLKNASQKYFLAYNVTDKTVIPAIPGGGVISRAIELVKTPLEQKPAGLQTEPEKPRVNMDAYTKKTTNGDGKSKIVLEAGARQAIQEAKSASVLIFNIGKDATAGTLEISREVLAQLQDKDMSLQIDIAQGNYLIQADALDISDIAAKLNSPNMVVQIQVSETSAQQRQFLQNSLGKNYSLQSIPQSTEIFCVAGEKQVKISEFASYISRDLLVNNQFIPSQCTVLCWEEGSYTPRVVPAVFVERDGKTYARAYSRSNSVYAVAAGSKTFADIENNPARQDVELLASKMILSGKSNQIFDPNGNVNRAELAAMLVRALGLKEQTGSTSCFSDVQGTEWFAGYVGAAAQAKIIKGMPDGSFKPQQNVSQQEAAVMMSNALNLAGVKTVLGTNEKATLIAQLSDHDNIAAWASPAVAAAIKTGIIKSNSVFNAAHKSNRAESASMIAALLRAAAFIDDRNEILKGATATAPATEAASTPDTREEGKGTLVVEGPALVKKQVFILDDLKAMTDITVNDVYFSRGKAKDNWAAEQSDNFTGVSIYKLLMNKIGFKTQPTQIEVMASDGLNKTFTVDEFTGLYMNEKNASARLEMILAWAQNGNEFKYQSDQPFQIVFGQKYENDFNRQNWVKYVKKILVY